ncbi:MAG: L-rhamnose/proton symporter RhaT [Tannerellaceae bacterium]|jgi:L-rhamnose-H+ transport protein|nr:L-rhamnose/proton symporter RhaT [Tannerellaceae bacterium]
MNANILIGLAIIAAGSFAQSSSYAPINRVKQWRWECFWLVQGIFAWLLFPLLGALLAAPSVTTLMEIYAGAPVWKSIVFGAFWGIGGLTFGLSMRYLGIALGQSIALGMCSAFGTMIPALSGKSSGTTAALTIGVSVMLAGIAIVGYAGHLRERSMPEEEKRKAIRDFAFTKGLLVALLAGAASACFNLGLEAGASVQENALRQGVHELLALNPVILLVTLGGFFTNAAYCLYRNRQNSSFSDYFSVGSRAVVNNVLFCALAGLLWYSQFFGLGAGKAFLSENPAMLAFSWSILMSLNILFSNVWGVILKEWEGAGRRAALALVVGMIALIVSLVIPNLI